MWWGNECDKTRWVKDIGLCDTSRLKSHCGPALPFSIREWRRIGSSNMADSVTIYNLSVVAKLQITNPIVCANKLWIISLRSLLFTHKLNCFHFSVNRSLNMSSKQAHSYSLIVCKSARTDLKIQTLRVSWTIVLMFQNVEYIFTINLFK